MSYIIRTRCPNECKYKSGYTCVASECPYQTGDVRYEIRLNAEDKPTKINAQVKQAVKQFAERLKNKFNDYEVTSYNGYEEGWHDLQEQIDDLLKEYGIGEKQ